MPYGITFTTFISPLPLSQKYNNLTRNKEKVIIKTTPTKPRKEKYEYKKSR